MVIVERDTLVEVPVNKAYKQWANFSDLPKFMDGIHEVHMLDDSTMRCWEKRGGKDFSWIMEITQQIPNEFISWRCTNGNPAAGTVAFVPIGENATRINFALEYHPDGFSETLGDALGRAISRIERVLIRFKTLVEEATDEPQSDSRIVANVSDRAANVEVPVTVNGHGVGAATGDSTSPAANEPRHSGPVSTNELRLRDSDRRQRERRQSNFVTEASSSTDFSSASLTLPSNWRRWTNEFDRLVASFAHRQFHNAVTDRMVWTPQLDATERNGELVISADLPGVDKDDLRIEIDQDILTLRGERREEPQARDRHVLQSERNYGCFSRSIRLPQDAVVDHVKATFDNGVLQVAIRTAGHAVGRRAV